VELSLTETQVSFKIQQYKKKSPLVDGQYPDTSRSCPTILTPSMFGKTAVGQRFKRPVGYSTKPPTVLSLITWKTGGVGA